MAPNMCSDREYSGSEMLMIGTYAMQRY